MDIEELLERYGWTLESDSPLEISHEDGSLARGLPAELLIEHLREQETGGSVNSSPRFAIIINCRCGNPVNTDSIDCEAYNLCKNCAMDS